MKNGLLLLFFTLTTILLHAQPGMEPPPEQVPITGGILVLILAGLGLGFKRFIKK